MKGTIVNNLRHVKVQGSDNKNHNPGDLGLPGAVVAYADMTEIVKPGKYHFIPYASAMVSSNGGNFPVGLFLCPETERAVFPVFWDTSGFPTKNIIGKNFLGVYMPVGNGDPGFSPNKSFDIASREPIYCPYGFFIRAVQVKTGSGDSSAIVYLEYMFCEMDECDNAE